MTAAAFRHVGPTEANERIREFRAVYAAVFAEPPYNEGPEMADKFVRWVHEESTEPGFDLVEALVNQQVVGFAYGYTRPPGEWWRGTDRPDDDVRIHPTFAVMEWAVLPDHRGSGIGRRLMDELVAGRSEPVATLTVNPAAPARGMYLRGGWSHVGSTKSGAMPGMDVMLLRLRPGPSETAS